MLLKKNLCYQMYMKGLITESAYHFLIQSLDLEIEMMRSQGVVPENAPHGFMKHLSIQLIAFIDEIPGLRKFANRLRISQSIRDYEEIWALHQGSLVILDHLDEIARTVSPTPEVIKRVRECFVAWNKRTRMHIDNIVAQYPEFVTDMQNRLGTRLFTRAKFEVINAQAKKGLLPKGVVEGITKKLKKQILVLRKPNPEKFVSDPYELLHKVPFFKGIQAKEFESIVAMLKTMNVPAGSIIVKEGEPGESMFLITRGVVRVLKGDVELATLVAGDFFGETAILHKTKRTATCRAVMPCTIFSLKRKDVDKLRGRYPAIQAALLQGANR